MSNIFRVTWRVTPLHAPQPRRHCGSCNAATSFISSGRFRTNAQKKRMDVWLIYRCPVCDETWNMPILERCPITRIPPDQLQSFIRNDPLAATHHAFDLPRLTRHSDQIDQDTEVMVEKCFDGGSIADATCSEITIALNLPCRLRLDSLLAREIGTSRRALSGAHEAGALTLAPTSRKAVRAPVCDGQRIRIDLSKAGRWGIEPDRICPPVT